MFLFLIKSIYRLLFTPCFQYNSDMLQSRITISLVVLASIIIVLSCTKEEPVMNNTDVNFSSGIPGLLGKPLGTILRVEGLMREGESKADEGKRLLEVKQIDGESSGGTIILPVETFAWAPVILPDAGSRVLLIGYETGAMTGIPEEAFTYIPRVATTNFHFASWFQALGRE